MNKKELRNKQYLAWDHYQERAISKDVLNVVTKFHQITTSVYFPSMNSSMVNADILKWTKQVENTDILPNYYNYSYKLTHDHKEITGSNWIFNKKYEFSKNKIGNILFSAFGRDRESKSKNYPSAGALYPVFPVLYVLDRNVVKGLKKEGCYVFDPEAVDLKLIQSFDKVSVEKFRQFTVNDKEVPSNIAIGYALDIKRAITKYRTKGYRLALIEAGLMAQSLKMALSSEGDFGELCWGGFSDNALTHLSGLNVKLSPVILLQWIGKRGIYNVRDSETK